MAEETPRNPQQTTFPEILEDLNQAGFKITGKLKALMLSGEEDGVLHVRELGDPFYDATCLACGTAYEERLGGMLLQRRGDATAVAITLGEQVFAGAGPVVIVMIAILIGLLLPAVQQVRAPAA